MHLSVQTVCNRPFWKKVRSVLHRKPAMIRCFQRAFSTHPHIKDLIVIGGGSGGLSVAKEAAKFGATVTLFDYVRPSHQGNTWGLGGTCVNVGCIPKKLMHHAGIIGSIAKNDASQFGWNINVSSTVDWLKLVEVINHYVRSLNFRYRVGLRAANVEYINANAKFTSPNTVEFISKNERHQLQGKNIVVAVGGRPTIPSQIKGAENCITSDEIFTLPRPPGKTLVIGGSYVALETAGFLNALGFPVILCIRSIALRGFDNQCSSKVLDSLRTAGVQILQDEPLSIQKESNNTSLTVSMKKKSTVKMNVDTVVLAAGRRPETLFLKTECLKSLIFNADDSIKVNAFDQTSVPNMYAIGDVTGRMELTPVAIKAGELLARRLFNNCSEVLNYENIPTTIFTPSEYGCVGMSQEKAEATYGKEGVEIFLQESDSLEQSPIAKAVEDKSLECLAKVICKKESGGKLPVIGIHFIGPHAGDIIQGLSLAVQLRADKKDLDQLIGIHPTNAEVFTQLNTTLRSGQNFRSSGGCGGGKCG